MRTNRSSFNSDVTSNQRKKRAPKKMGEVINQLMARRGYGQIKSTEEIRSLWKQITGPLGEQCLPGNVRRGVLEVFVRNSTVLQELTFRKKQILTQIQKTLPSQSITDLKFRISAFD